MAEPLCAHTLPLQGRQLIEASAGTGKTFNIARLFLRLLVERELPVQQILVMTFTRAATAELKARLAQAINSALEGWGAGSSEPFFAHLHAQQPAARARALLRRALLEMDEAAIFTIHGFCKRALTQQAFRSGISFHADMEAQTRSLILEALQDWYRQQSQEAGFVDLYGLWSGPEAFFASWGRVIAGTEPVQAPAMPDLGSVWRDLRAAWSEESKAFHDLDVAKRRSAHTRAEAEAVLDALSTALEADWQAAPMVQLASMLAPKTYVNTDAKQKRMPALYALMQQLPAALRAHRAALAQAGIDFARKHLAAAKDRLDQLDFSDLVSRLWLRLQDAQHGPALAAALLQQYPVALVDEFQDTDPEQYDILNAIYRSDLQPAPLLCMIGDPKQAIYGFRGGDVFAYLQAREDADAQWVMDTNYRSTADVIRGYNRLFYGRELAAASGAEVFGFGIDYHPVQAGRAELAGLEDPAPRGSFQWCLLPLDPALAGADKRGAGYTRAGQQHLARWSAREIARLLGEARVDGAALSPADIAILVRDRFEATEMQNALREVGLDAVYLSASDNVFNSEEAASLQQALQGILHLEDDQLLVAALATPWLGYDTAALHALRQDEHRWAAACAELAALRQQWFGQGFMKMALGLYQRHLQPLPARHERTLTNGLHLLELLQAASQHHRQPEALLHWFATARLEAEGSTGTEIQQLRLESDGTLIRLVTLHGAKGLEYPVVFLPFVSYGRDEGRQRPGIVRYHQRDDFSARHALEPTEQELAYYREEQAAEDIRLLYVGATRGVRRVYLMAAAFTSLRTSPLARCLSAVSWEALQNQVEGMVAAGDCMSLLLDAPASSPAVAAAAAPAAALTPAHFTGRIERDWWLSSFSALTRNVRHGGLSTPDRDGAAAPLADPAAPASGELRFALRRGAEAGNLLHDVLEHLDFQHPDFEQALDQAERRYPNLLLGQADWRTALTQWVTQQLAAPLPSGARLADLAHHSTLREVEFYFPMQGTADPDALGRILVRHRKGSEAPLPAPVRLKGMMHGYIDLVYGWEGRYYVVDYKSTFLGSRLGDYNAAALAADVQHNVYDLQYLLYTLALHRYLRTRLPDYDPAQHLGGVHYLYLRGLHPQGDTGIYHRVVDLEALAALDAFFQAREASA
ncbi:MAG: exodeoxyribonuclease V subunit beta [Halieaceae bacterium]|uniref:exodeoxyribonuclease V subunit beta n=1 Tax=Haliea alexandrii TaxID=2448162 RepID=UPI0013050205|nr:exodeoxyribonuclease V subunit beta [Haliea alexandrii]MCR9185682.1 exodeoxyribonuclease V subunit beta [Halieaceae bacterium]